MIDITEVLCPIDFSECSRHALEHAMAIAREHEARVTVLHALGIPPVPVPPAAYVGYGPPSLPPRAGIDEVTKAVRDFCDPLVTDGISPAVVVRDGLPVSVIVDQAADKPADLLIMGTHGRGGFDRLALGSVAERVIRKVRCPVLTVPPRASERAPGPVGYKTILCPIDFSPPSVRALEFALAWAQSADARLCLLHVFEPDVDEAGVRALAHFTVPEYHRYMKEDAEKRLQLLIPTDARTWCTPEHQLVSGKPYREILRVAAEAGAQLIVMGVAGRGAISTMVFGSTTNQVLRGAGCPVLTVRSAG